MPKHNRHLSQSMGPKRKLLRALSVTGPLETSVSKSSLHKQAATSSISQSKVNTLNFYGRRTYEALGFEYARWLAESGAVLENAGGLTNLCNLAASVSSTNNVILEDTSIRYTLIIDDVGEVLNSSSTTIVSEPVANLCSVEPSSLMEIFNTILSCGFATKFPAPLSANVESTLNITSFCAVPAQVDPLVMSRLPVSNTGNPMELKNAVYENVYWLLVNGTFSPTDGTTTVPYTVAIVSLKYTATGWYSVAYPDADYYAVIDTKDVGALQPKLLMVISVQNSSNPNKPTRTSVVLAKARKKKKAGGKKGKGKAKSGGKGKKGKGKSKAKAKGKKAKAKSKGKSKAKAKGKKKKKHKLPKKKKPKHHHKKTTSSSSPSDIPPPDSHTPNNPPTHTNTWSPPGSHYAGKHTSTGVTPGGHTHYQPPPSGTAGTATSKKNKHNIHCTSSGGSTSEGGSTQGSGGTGKIAHKHYWANWNPANDNVYSLGYWFTSVGIAMVSQIHTTSHFTAGGYCSGRWKHVPPYPYRGIGVH